MKHGILLLILIAFNSIFRTWRKIPENLPTLLYAIFTNFLYYFITQKKPVWDFRTTHLPIQKVRILHCFFITPLMIHLYLSGAPMRLGKEKAIYLFRFTVASTIFEWLANQKLKMLAFYNGWNIKWSVLLYIHMYLFCYYYKKYPLFISILSVLSIEQYVRIFKVPVYLGMLRPKEIQAFFYSKFLDKC